MKEHPNADRTVVETLASIIEIYKAEFERAWLEVFEKTVRFNIDI